MNTLPKTEELLDALGRLLLWGIPLAFFGPNPYHGYQWEIMVIIPGAWVMSALYGLVANPERDAKIFYFVWLVGAASLAWWQYVLPKYAA